MIFCTCHQASGYYNYTILTFTIANEKSSTEFLENKIIWPKDRTGFRCILYLIDSVICVQQVDLLIKTTCLQFRIDRTINSNYMVWNLHTSKKKNKQLFSSLLINVSNKGNSTFLQVIICKKHYRASVTGCLALTWENRELWVQCVNFSPGRTAS